MPCVQSTIAHLPLNHLRFVACVALTGAAASACASETTDPAGPSAGATSAGGQASGGGGAASGGETTMAGGAAAGGSDAAGGGDAVGGGAGQASGGDAAGGSAGNAAGGSAGNAAGGSAGNAAGGSAGNAAGGSAGNAAGGGAGGGAGGAGTKVELSFFVTSKTHPSGDLGGLAGADATCLELATAVGAGDRTWAAYLSADGPPAVNAADRIGNGPWVNAKGVTVAADLAALHALTGNADLFIDEKGEKINGQWAGSPSPNQHDILTGSTATGMLQAGKTCEGWTSASMALKAQVGHSDGLGPNMDMNPPRNSWNSAHESAGCNDTTPRGGAGRFYCFATD